MLSGAMEALYPRCPIWLQNLGITLYGLSWRRERLGRGFDEAVEAFEQRETLDAQAMQQHVDQQLRTVLTAALRDVPAYRQAWGELRLTAGELGEFRLADLPRLPLTSKEELRRDPWAFVSDQYSGRRRHLRAYYTSGSTGTPVTAICQPADHRRFIAAREARSFRWAGTSLREARSMIGGRMVVPASQKGPPFHRVNAAERQLYFSAFHISAANARFYVEALNRHRPALLTGYAQSHYLLGALMLEQGLRLAYRPSALVLSSEKLTAEMKATLREAFGARAWEEWGCVENCALATECPQGRLHVSPDFGIVEVIRDDGTPAAAGEPGRVLCTGLLNEVQPLIRYEVGDVATWAKEPCPCGRDGLPVLDQVIGRIEDVVVGPDGRRLVRFHGVFVGLNSVREGQVVQRAPDRILVRVAAAGDLSASDRAEIERRILERLGAVSVDIEAVDGIPRMKNGKYRAVVNEVAGGGRGPGRTDTDA